VDASTPFLRRLLPTSTLPDTPAYRRDVAAAISTGRARSRVRIGIATVKGLAFGSERPVAAVPTLAALALGAGDGSAAVAALLDARRGEVYAAIFGPDGAPLAPDAVLTPDALAARLPPGTRIVAGEGAGPAAGALPRSSARRCACSGAHGSRAPTPSASSARAPSRAGLRTVAPPSRLADRGAQDRALPEHGDGTARTLPFLTAG
jgi:tRNA threonylcarbamoyladenosine biosynthesis protein TsaB